MKKALPVLVIGILGIAIHFSFYSDGATTGAHFLAGQVAQSLVNTSPDPAPVAAVAKSAPAPAPASTLLVLMISSVATLIYVGYTWSDAFGRD